VRQWIRTRDIDQDGMVSLSEFVSSFVRQLDPAIHNAQNPSTLALAESALSIAFGTLRLGSSVPECGDAITALEEYIQRIVDSPSNHTFWRISKSDKNFSSRIGRLFGGEKLLLGSFYLFYLNIIYTSKKFTRIIAFGFEIEDNGTTFVLKDPNGFRWDTVPADIRNNLLGKLDELRSHNNAMLEPSISNIAAVSSAIGHLGVDSKSLHSWIVALETILLVVSNIVQSPKTIKYYKINSSNQVFHQKIGRIPHAVGIEYRLD
jgi:hypothetical protein